MDGMSSILDIPGLSEVWLRQLYSLVVELGPMDVLWKMKDNCMSN